jgi:AcrR family transcriptional regulator
LEQASGMTARVLDPAARPTRVAAMDMTDSQNRAPRRPQAERTADMRTKLFEAAIICLNRSGYSATTVSTVAAEAKVSRGAMTHHFPAKTDLMLAVVEYVFEQDSAFYNNAINVMDPVRFLVDLPEMMWGVISRPAGIAVIEIMLASRSEPGLGERLRDLQSDIDIRSHKWVEDRVAAAGFRPHPEGPAIHELFVGAVRGLAIEATFMNNSDGVQRSLRVLSEMMRHFYPALAAPEAKTDLTV